MCIGNLTPPAPLADTAAALPLCLLTPEMHNRSLVDGAFRAAGAMVRPAMETDSVLTLALSVVAGQVCSVLPGALVDAVRGHEGLEGAASDRSNAYHAHRIHVAPTGAAHARPRCRAGPSAGPRLAAARSSAQWASGRRLSADPTGCGV